MIRLKNNDYTLKEFIENDKILQGNIICYYFKKDFANIPKFKTIKYSNCFKLKESDDVFNIFYTSTINSDLDIKENTIKTLLHVDIKNHVILYINEDILHDINKELKDNFSNYIVFNNQGLYKYLSKEYNHIICDYLNNNFNRLMQIKEYKERYEQTYNNEKKSVQFNIIHDRKTQFNITKNIINKNNLNELAKYISDMQYFTNIVKYHCEECIDSKNDLILSHAYLTAMNKLKEDILKNPDDDFKLLMKINESIKKGGKTLNVITNDDKKHKVENILYGTNEFKTVIGYDYISYKNIKKITFSKKILFEK